jgi:hypothetical protein
MNYKSFNLGDWIGHISGVIEDETTLDGNEMRDLVEFLTTLKQEPILDKIRAEIKALNPEPTAYDVVDGNPIKDAVWETLSDVIDIIDKYKAESDHKCHTCKHYTSGEQDGSCDSYICEQYSAWEVRDKE